MQFHELHLQHKKKAKKRKGRGGKKGTYSGHGMKGQKSRAGARMQPSIRELVKRYPKLRGQHFQGREDLEEIVNVGALDRMFEANADVTPETLFAKGALAHGRGWIPVVKILGTGTVSKPLKVAGCRISKSAKSKIEEAGGTVAS